jgi:hypothetical protein
MEASDLKKFFEDVTNLVKAIGTSSSANEERDERSVENYVRQSANTNTNERPDYNTGMSSNNIGGSIVSNTTEPDPQGGIAVTKDFPSAAGGPLINQETRPTSDVSVAAAPNGDSAVVPNEATIPSSATSAIAPSKTDEVQTADKVTIAKGEKCPTCGAIAKGDETEAHDAIEKAANCPDCGKELNLCNCVGKAVDAESAKEDAKETATDEKAEMKKSLWGGAFAPTSNLK